MKNEVPAIHLADWGNAFVDEVVSVRYQQRLCADNGLHFWFDCHSTRLCEMREHFGLPTLRRDDGAYLLNFHCTIARRKRAIAPTFRPRWRLSPQSHVDLLSGTPHL